MNLDANGSLAATGPNRGPAISGSRDSCGADLVDGYTQESAITLEAGSVGQTATVQVRGGAGKMLGRLANWVGTSSPWCEGCSHWHLLTDCFPPAGTVGIAFGSTSCQPLVSRRGYVTDSGSACGDTCDVKLANGNAALTSYSTITSCAPTDNVCVSPVALTSWTGPDTWRTFAHEVGHTFGAGERDDGNSRSGTARP